VVWLPKAEICSGTLWDSGEPTVSVNVFVFDARNLGAVLSVRPRQRCIKLGDTAAHFDPEERAARTDGLLRQHADRPHHKPVLEGHRRRRLAAAAQRALVGGLLAECHLHDLRYLLQHADVSGRYRANGRHLLPRTGTPRCHVAAACPVL